MRSEAVADAPAKLNLALHVTGRRADGYHTLDSLVVFAGVGDRVSASAASDWSLTVDGPLAAGVPTDGTNLVLRAAMATQGPPAALRLTKRLPHAAGLGGGSSDAAAAIRALHLLDGRDAPAAPETLGADVPACLALRPLRMQGIGERLTPVPPLPACHVVIVNPGVPLSTPDVFRALESRDNAPLPKFPKWRSARALADWLATTRNDLQPPATRLAPDITTALDAIADTPGCLIARMTGSGASCFGLYAGAADAEAAARGLAASHPHWWIAPAQIL